MNIRLIAKFAPYLALVALLFVVLFQRNTITDRTAKLDAAELRGKELARVNGENANTILSLSNRQYDNDAIARSVIASLNGNAVREVETRTIIERVQANDPKVRAWGDSPVPDSVRQALRASPQRSDAR